MNDFLNNNDKKLYANELKENGKLRQPNQLGQTLLTRSENC